MRLILNNIKNKISGHSLPFLKNKKNTQQKLAAELNKELFLFKEIYKLSQNLKLNIDGKKYKTNSYIVKSNGRKVAFFNLKVNKIDYKGIHITLKKLMTSNGLKYKDETDLDYFYEYKLLDEININLLGKATMLRIIHFLKEEFSDNGQIYLYLEETYLAYEKSFYKNIFKLLKMNGVIKGLKKDPFRYTVIL